MWLCSLQCSLPHCTGKPMLINGSNFLPQWIMCSKLGGAKFKATPWDEYPIGSGLAAPPRRSKATTSSTYPLLNDGAAQEDGPVVSWFLLCWRLRKCQLPPVYFTGCHYAKCFTVMFIKHLVHYSGTCLWGGQFLAH